MKALQYLCCGICNTTASEHKAIIQRFVKIAGTDNVIGVLADREFGSGK